ncbi:hypothetical protein [Labrys wisconsinensis]|uniref:Uncharacterized protein n=1 Tax=Labrys wisconsinensis TaxID=425677 RepID=A0ABU0JF59_9HYPH|nr:hypothetical protein [Labrys wisconsinensis]MDQ0472914.1 hypothetical protein [Labrys wisconsinensis]
MRFSQIFGVPESDKPDEAAGVTLDVMTGIVAGIALVLAILILAASLKPAQAAHGAEPVRIEAR